MTLKAPVRLLGHQETGRQQAAREVEAEVAIKLKQPPAQDEIEQLGRAIARLLLLLGNAAMTTNSAAREEVRAIDRPLACPEICPELGDSDVR